MRVLAFPDPPTPLDRDELWDQVTEVAGQVNLLHARLVDLTVQLIDTDAWGGDGIRSPEHWLALRAGLSPSTATQLTTVARARTRLPALSALVDAGRLSLDQSATVAARVPAAYAESVCELAPLMTVTQLRRVVSRYPFDPDEPATPAGATDAACGGEDTADNNINASAVAEAATTDTGAGTAGTAQTGADASGTTDSGPVNSGPANTDLANTDPTNSESACAGSGSAFAPGDPGLRTTLPDEPGRACQPSRVTAVWDEGRYVLRADLDAADGALLEMALREAKDALFTASNPDATIADALVEIASRSLGAVESPARASHYRVYVHMDTEGAWVNARGTLAFHLASRLACTADAAALWHTQGLPISVGRSQRATPERLRRLVEDRDRGCAFPGCPATRFVEIHHVRHWAEGGGTDYDNLISLCPHHHDAHHAGEFRITGTDNPIVPFAFHNRHGLLIRATPPSPTRPPRAATAAGSATPDGTSRASAFQPPLGARVNNNWIEFRKRDARNPHNGSWDDGDAPASRGPTAR